MSAVDLGQIIEMWTRRGDDSIVAGGAQEVMHLEVMVVPRVEMPASCLTERQEPNS